MGRASAYDIQRGGYNYVPDVLQQTVPGAIPGCAGQRVPARSAVPRLRGLPVDGVPQGLAVYQNGVRINEAFGDIVNWEFLPDNSIDGITIIGANPVFGLNALGGAVTIQMRDGFNYQGAELDVRGGSFGRYQGALTFGANNGSWAAFMALEGIHDNGFRDFTKPMIRRMYADLGAKGDDTEFHLNYTGADDFVGVTAAAPVQLLDQNWSNTFTSPQTTVNQVNMISLNGTLRASPTLTFSGVSYYRWFNQKHVDGNISEAQDCTTTLRCSATTATTPSSSSASAPASTPTARYLPNRLAPRLARPHHADRQQLGLAGQASQVEAVRARQPVPSRCQLD